MAAQKSIHAYGDDALGTDDAVALMTRLRQRKVSASELTEAALSRLEKVKQLNATVSVDPDAARLQAQQHKGYGLFSGIPTFIKDNTDVIGLNTTYGSKAFPPIVPKQSCAFAEQFVTLGMNCLGKSQLPEFGFNASTEFDDGSATLNPWHTDYSPGASSGGAGVLVAAGVVPVAHANDGGGSIRIPAACCGLVGLKPTRDRFINSDMARRLPINIISEGVVSRSVRDTAYFFAGMEQAYRNPRLSEIGLVSHASKRRLRIGVVSQTLDGTPIDGEVLTALDKTQWLLEDLGHITEPLAIPVYSEFSLDFCRYWGLLAFTTAKLGKYALHPQFDQRKMSAFSKGLVDFFYREALPSPLFVHRLKQVTAQYAKVFEQYDIVLSPTLGHVTPRLGFLSPTIEFDVLFERLRHWVCFTPFNNVAGSPAISLPLDMSSQGLPIGMHFSAAHGAERTLLELAYEIEDAKPWPQLFSH